jgi:thiol-disulfide isomerase/thioredoxin
MKKIIALLTINFFIAKITVAQVQYQTSVDEKHPTQKILTGIISKNILTADTSYKWYAISQSAYKTETGLVNCVAKTADKMQFVVFGGTWCEDTQFILPRFFKLLDAAKIGDEKVTFFGVNRAKKTWANMTEAFNVKNVPTIIVMKEGKEIGRVVEYGKAGQWDKELCEILNQ